MWRLVRDRMARTRIVGRIGRRGVVLFLVGLIWCVLGGTQLFQPVVRFSHPGPGGILAFADSPMVGLMWLLAGGAAVVCAVRHDRDTLAPNRAEVVGFNALLIPPGVYASMFAWSAALHAWNPDEGNARSAAGLLAWVVVLVLLLVIADWPEGTNGSGTAPRGPASAGGSTAR